MPIFYFIVNLVSIAKSGLDPFRSDPFRCPGGILVEVLKNIAMRVAPLTRFDVEEMMKELKGAKILQGFRGQPPADIAAVIDIALRFSQLSLDLKDDIAETDINPLMVFENGKRAKVVDCLMTRLVAEPRDDFGS